MNPIQQSRFSFLKRRYLHVVLPVFIGSIIAYLDRVNIAYAALTMNADMGFSAAVFGTGAGIFFAGYVLFEVPGALIAERWSPRIWLARIMITWGIVSVFMAFIRTEWQFYLVRFLLGAAEASFYPVVYASVIPRWFTPEERPRAIALMLTSLQISAIIGSPLAGWILGVTAFGLKGWQLLFVLEAFPAVIFGIVLLCILDDSPSDAKWLDPDEKDYLERKLLQENELKLSARRYTILKALTDREVLKLCFIYFLWITGFWGFNYWIPTALREMSGWSNLALGALIVIPMTLSLASMLGVAWSSSKTGEKRLHGAVSMFVGAAGFGFGAFASDPLWAFGLVCVTAAGVFAAFGVWWSYPTTFLSGAAAAGAVGLINSFGNIGGYAGPYITGFIRDTAGSFHWAYITLSCSLAAAGLLMLTLRHGVQHGKSV